MDEFLERLTGGDDEIMSLCLLIELEDDKCLKMLDKMNITGKKIEKLFYKCCKQSIECTIQTIRYLASGQLPDRIIHANLKNNNPIPFIDYLHNEKEDLKTVYNDYTNIFITKRNNPTKRR